MVTRKKTTPTAAQAPAPASTTVQHCTFVAEAARCSPEAARAAEALAQASARHADALTAIAKALAGTPGTMDAGIRIGANHV